MLTRINGLPALAGVVLILSPATEATAMHSKGSSILIEHAWIRMPPPAAPTAAGYLTIVNNGKVPDRLVGASSAVVNRVELHNEMVSGGIMRMPPIRGGLVVAPGRAVSIGPGGMHLMLIGLKRPFQPGQRIPLSLKFQTAGMIQVPFVVKSTLPTVSLHREVR